MERKGGEGLPSVWRNTLAVSNAIPPSLPQQSNSGFHTGCGIKTWMRINFSRVGNGKTKRQKQSEMAQELHLGVWQQTAKTLGGVATKSQCLV